MGLFVSTRLVKVVTTSFLTLIHKVHSPQSLAEYRPICLVGSLYKVLAMLLAFRLKLVIGNLISPKQTTFFPGHNILDSVLLDNEAIDLALREKKKCLASV